MNIDVRSFRIKRKKKEILEFFNGKNMIVCIKNFILIKLDTIQRMK